MVVIFMLDILTAHAWACVHVLHFDLGVLNLGVDTTMTMYTTVTKFQFSMSMLLRCHAMP